MENILDDKERTIKWSHGNKDMYNEMECGVTL